MPDVSDIMTTDVQVVAPSQTLTEAARLMQALDIGALPVCEGRLLVGMVTDRDIALRGVAAGLRPDVTPVSQVMTTPALWVTGDQDTTEVLRVMGECQVRRLPVIDVDKRLVGIVSLADLALRQPATVDEAVREISQPDAGVVVSEAAAPVTPAVEAP